MTILTRKAVFLQGAIAAYMAPKMAQDGKLDIGKLFVGVTAKNFTEKKPGIITALRKTKLAQDATLDDLSKCLDTFAGMEVAEGADIDPNSALPMTAEEMKKKADDAALAEKTAKDEKAKSFRESLSEDQRKAFDEVMGTEATAGDEDETDEDKAKREAEKKKAEDAAKAPTVDKAAMDAAIDSAVKATRRTMQEIAVAKDDVEQYVGKLSPTLAFDTAADVYGAALKAKNVDIKDVHPSAYKAILHAQAKLGDSPSRERMAQDTEIDTTGFHSRYGDLVKAA